MPPSPGSHKMRPVSAFAKVGLIALILGVIGGIGAWLWLPDWLPPAAGGPGAPPGHPVPVAARHQLDHLRGRGVVPRVLDVEVPGPPRRHVRRRAHPRPHGPRDHLDDRPHRDRAQLRGGGHGRPQPQRVAQARAHGRERHRQAVRLVVHLSQARPPAHGHPGAAAGPPGRVPPARAAHRRDPQLQDPGASARRGRRPRHPDDRSSPPPPGWGPTRSCAPSCAASATARCATSWS